MPLSSIKKQNVGDMVFQQLRSAIISGEWAPGSKLPSENELAATLSVSRVSVRSALQRLSSIGLIETRRGDGSYVSDLNASQPLNSMIPFIALKGSDLRSMNEFRRIVETESAALTAARATADLVEALRAANERMAAGSALAAAEADLEFHRLLISGTQNPILIKVFEILEDYYLQLFQTNISIMGTKGSVQHNALIGAISIGDSGRAREIMREHLETASRETEHL